MYHLVMEITRDDIIGLRKEAAHIQSLVNDKEKIMEKTLKKMSNSISTEDLLNNKRFVFDVIFND